MAVNRAHIVDENLIGYLESRRSDDIPRTDPDLPARAAATLTGRELLDIAESMFQSRLMDLAARELKSRDTGYYTIAGAGHECNAAVAAALRPTDPAFLHYRSGAFFAQRAKQLPGQTPIFDVLLSLCASSDDPIAEGRHKVFGSRELWIPPQTSTIGSHPPKAMGAAFAIERAKRLRLPLPIPGDSITVATFGDASANHSTTTGAINAACWAAHQNLPMPVLFVCEDNGVGISVHTPTGWIEADYGCREDMAYFKCDGLDPVDAFEAARSAADYVRRRRAPAFLHLELVRLLGHAGSDVETNYHDRARIEAEEARDPLLSVSRFLIDSGLATADDLLGLIAELRARISAAAGEAETRPHLSEPSEIMRPLAPFSPERVEAEAGRTDFEEARAAAYGGTDRLPEQDRPRHLAVNINRALHELLAKYPQSLLFGEDVAKKGGVYNVSAGLYDRFGVGRVFNTLLDETSIFGLAMGAAHLGFLPLPEIQYLAYVHNALDQVRGEASSLQFFSNDQYRNPMVIRMASWGYQRGFGGHFHNDNSIAALRDIPGIVIACPSRGDDAAAMLRTCMAMAAVDGRVVFFLEPIALYMTKDLHEDRDGLWQFPYPAPGSALPFGAARVYDDPLDPTAEPAPANDAKAELTIVSFANGLWRSLRAARILADEHDIRTRVVDLRWLQPLDAATLTAEARAASHLLIVDEGRRTGGLSEAVITLLVDELETTELPAIRRYCGHDTFIPLGPAWEAVLPDEPGIVRAALNLLGREAP